MTTTTTTIDLSDMPIRSANELIRGCGAIHESIDIINPDAKHYIAVGLTNPVDVRIFGSAGYFCGGLCDGPSIAVENNVSWGVGDNMQSGRITVGGNAGAIAGVALRGGEIVIKGNMGSRSGQVMKKGTLCCAGNASFMAGYMMYGGRIIILGDSGEKVGENMAGGEIFVGGEVASVGSDACLCLPSSEDLMEIEGFLGSHGLSFSGTFKKIVCAGNDLTYGTPEPPAKKIPFPVFSSTKSAYWNEKVQEDIQVKSRIGRYRVRGFGTARHIPHFNDIAFKKRIDVTEVDGDPVSKVDMRTFIGNRHGGRPLDLSMPVMIAPMSFGALGADVKIALGMASNLSGISENTGEGGMHSLERAEARQLIAQCLSGRLGWNIHDMKRADGIELYISQGAKPGLGGQLMAAKLTKEIAAMRGIPEGMDLRSPSRHPDVLGGDDLIMKIREFREAVGGRLPVSLKLGGGRTRDDVKIAFKDNLDFVELDGLQGGTGAGGNEVLEYVGIPTISAIMEAMDGLGEIDAQGQLPIVLMGGIQNGVDAAKAIALGATAVGIGTPMLVAAGCIGCMRCSSGKCPLGLTTQDPKLTKRFDIDENAQKMHRYLESIRWQMAAIAHGLGHENIHDLCRDDLVALTPEAAALTRLPYAPETAHNGEPTQNIENTVEGLKENGNGQMNQGAEIEGLAIKQEVDELSAPASSVTQTSETGIANYPKKSFEIIGQMASTSRENIDEQHQLMTAAMATRENPYPQERPAHLDDVVFLSAALTRLVIDPYREACNTRTEISRSKGLSIKERQTDLPTIDLERPFLFTGFDTAPAGVKTALAKALSHMGCAYLGRTPLDESIVAPPLTGTTEQKRHPWLQLLLPGDTPDARADALIHVAGERFTPFEVTRLHPNQLVGIAATSGNLSDILEFALDNQLDALILDHTQQIGQDAAELNSPMDLTVMRDAVRQLRKQHREEEIALINFGGLRSGTDVAKALAYNCNASVFGLATAIAMGGTVPENTNASKASIEFPDEPDEAALYQAAVNWIKGTEQECAIIARCTGKTNVHNLEPEDMRCITLATSEALDIPLTSGATLRERF